MLNADLAEHLSDETLDYRRSLPVQLEFETIQGNLLLCHGMAQNDLRKVWPGTERMPPEGSRELDHLISEGKHNFVINGHIHFKVMVHFRQLTLINAGNLTGDHWPGFTVIDFENNDVQAYMFDGDTPGKGKRTSLTGAETRQVFETTECFQGDWEPKLLFER